MHLALSTDCLQQLMRMAAYVQQNHTAHAYVCQHCLSRRSDFRGFSGAGSRRNQPCRMAVSDGIRDGNRYRYGQITADNYLFDMGMVEFDIRGYSYGYNKVSVGDRN
jgi:hypothetical protein